jgi:oligoribonuclease (3'-5' exoribonuclease)
MSASQQLIGLDIETTGLNKQVDQILEIYACAYDSETFVVTDEFHGLLKPEAITQFSDWIRETHTRNGLFDDVLKEGKEASIIYFEFKEWLAKYPKALFTGKNVGTFDVAFLEAKHPGITEAQHYRCVDISTLLFAKRQYFNTAVLPYATDVHRAKPDVENDRAILMHLADFWEGYQD